MMDQMETFFWAFLLGFIFALLVCATTMDNNEKQKEIEYVEVPACMKINETIYCPKGFVKLGEIEVDETKISDIQFIEFAPAVEKEQ